HLDAPGRTDTHWSSSTSRRHGVLSRFDPAAPLPNDSPTGYPPVRAAADPCLSADLPVPPDVTATVRAVWLADLDPARVRPGPGVFVFVPGSLPDDVTGHWCVEAAGAGDVLRVVSFAEGETDEGLDLAQPIVVEGELVVIRHPARGEFPALVELQVRRARRAR